MQKIGITFGCFIPMHIGHVKMIQKSRRENDRTIIAVCGYPADRGKDFIKFHDRLKLTKFVYDEYEDTIVTGVNDRKIGLTGTFSLKAWQTWCNELFRNAGLDPFDKNTKYTWYTGEASYTEKIKQLYENHDFIGLDRNEVPISGTEIRNNPEKYYYQIHPVFREYLHEKKILEQNESLGATATRNTSRATHVRDAHASHDLPAQAEQDRPRTKERNDYAN